MRAKPFFLKLSRQTPRKTPPFWSRFSKKGRPTQLTGRLAPGRHRLQLLPLLLARLRQLQVDAQHQGCASRGVWAGRVWPRPQREPPVVLLFFVLFFSLSRLAFFVLWCFFSGGLGCLKEPRMRGCPSLVNKQEVRMCQSWRFNQSHGILSVRQPCPSACSFASTTPTPPSQETPTQII